MIPILFYCSNQSGGQCIYPAEGGFDPETYFSDPCQNVDCPRYLPPYLSSDHTPISRIQAYDTPFTVPSPGIRFEYTDGAASPTRTYPESAEDLAVVPYVAWYAASGYALGVDSEDGYYGIRYHSNQFFAPEDGDYQFLVIGYGQIRFELDEVYILGAADEYEDLSSSSYTLTDPVSLSGGVWYDFEITYRRIETGSPAGLCVLWRNDASWREPTVLSAGAANYQGAFLQAEEVEGVGSLSLTRQGDDIAQADFTLSLNRQGEGDGYYYDSSQQSYVHNGSGPSIKPHRLFAVDTGFQTAGGNQYRTILTGHLIEANPERSTGTDTIGCVVRDFGHLLTTTHSENYPEELDYWIAGYVDTLRPNGSTAPAAFDAWELHRVVEVLAIRAGIDPILLRTRRRYFDGDGTVIEGERLVLASDPPVLLESRKSYGQPDVQISPSDETQDIIDEAYHWQVGFGEQLVDVINNIVDNYGWQWGFLSGHDVSDDFPFTGGPFLFPKNNALYVAQASEALNMVWFGDFEADAAWIHGYLSPASDDGDTDTTPLIVDETDHTPPLEGSGHLVKMNTSGDGIALRQMRIRKGEVYAFTVYAAYDGDLSNDIRVKLFAGTRYANPDSFHSWHNQEFVRTDTEAADVPGDDTWRRYKLVLTAPEDDVLTLKVVVTGSITANAFVYLDALQVVKLPRATFSLPDFSADEDWMKHNVGAWKYEYYETDFSVDGEQVLCYPFRGTRVDLVFALGDDNTEGVDDVTCVVKDASDDSIVEDQDGNNIDVDYDLYYASARYHRDGKDSSGVNPCIKTLAQGLPLGDYYVEITTLAGVPRIDAILVYGQDPGFALTFPGVRELTFRTKGDSSEPFTAATIGGLNPTLQISDQRNDCIVIGQAQGLWTPSPEDDVPVDPANPVWQYVFARAINRDSMFNPGAVDFVGRKIQTVIVEPKISSRDRANWLAAHIVEQYRLAPQDVSAPVIHNPVLDLWDPVKMLDVDKGTVTTDVIWIESIETSFDSGAQDDLSVQSVIRGASYVPLHDIDLAAFGGQFLEDASLENNGNVWGTLDEAMTDESTSCVVTLPATGPGSEQSAFPKKGYILIEGNDTSDLRTWEFIQYESVDDGTPGQVTLSWSDNDTQRALYYRQRQLADDEKGWLYDTALDPVAHDSGKRVYAPYDPYLSEELSVADNPTDGWGDEGPQLVKIHVSLIQSGYLKVEVLSFDPDNVSRIPKLVVANLTNSSQTDKEGEEGERWRDRGTYTFYWDGVANKSWNEACADAVDVDEDLSGASGFYAAEFLNGDWDGPYESRGDGNLFKEEIHTSFRVRFTLRTQDGQIFEQTIGEIYTRRGPKVEEVTVIVKTDTNGEVDVATIYDGSDVDSKGNPKNIATEDHAGLRFTSRDNNGRGLVVKMVQEPPEIPYYPGTPNRRKIHEAFLEMNLIRYAEFRNRFLSTGPNNYTYGGVQDYNFGNFNITSQLSHEWSFSVQPQEFFSYAERGVDILAALKDGDRRVVEDWRDDTPPELLVIGAWLLHFRLSVTDRSGRRARSSHVYVQWAGDGIRYTTKWADLPVVHGDNSYRGHLYPAYSHAAGGWPTLEIPTITEPNDISQERKKKWYWWGHTVWDTRVD